MNVTQLKPIIIALYRTGRTGMFWGAPGIGKSDSFRAAAAAIAKVLNLTGGVLEMHQVADFIAKGGDIRTAFGMFDLRLSQCDPVDVGGLPRENADNGSMDRLPPSWFAHTQRVDLPDHGILLLDELPSAPLSVQSAAYQITLDGVIGAFKLKPGWRVFAAGNRMTDGGQYFKMPNALANRMCHIDVESDLNSWTGWAIDRGIEQSLLAFVRLRPDLLNTYEEHVTKKTKGMAFATERQWHAVHDLLTNAAGTDDETLQAILAGLVGSGPAAEYMGFRAVWHKMPSIDQILIDPKAAPLPEDAATQYAVMTALAARTTYDNMPNVVEYVDRFNQMGRPELGMLCIRDVIRRAQVNSARDPSITNPTQSAAFTTWAHRNQGLFG